MAKQKTLQDLLDSIDKRVKAKLEKLMQGLTEKQRLALIQNPNLIDELLKDFNPDELAKFYQSELVGLAGKVMLDYSKQFNAAQTTKVKTFVNTLMDLKTESLRNFIQANKTQFKTKLVEMIINGSDAKAVTDFFAKTPFTTAQIGTLINTAESEIRRTTVLSAFENNPEQRYEYIGGVIPTSSDQCAWLYENQNPEGYTLDEIQAGIETPYGTIDWGGRIPNYNCIHSWEPIV